LVLTKLYGDFAHDLRLTLAAIQTNVDPKRDLSKESVPAGTAWRQ